MEDKVMNVLDVNSPEIQELMDKEEVEVVEQQESIEDAVTPPQEEEMSIDDKLRLLEEKEQKIQKMEWKQKYGLDDDAMSLVTKEEDAEKLSKLLKKQNTFKPSNTRKEVLPITKNEFKAMNYNQRATLYKQNPELYESLKK